MYQMVSIIRYQKFRIQERPSLFTCRLLLFAKHHCHTHPSLSPSPPPDFSGIAESIISKYPLFVDKEKIKISVGAPRLQCLLFEILDVIPDTARRSLWESVLKPQDVLHILLEFQHECEGDGFQAAKVGSLWKIFSTVSSEGLKHLPLACESMASMLTRVGMLREVETLLSHLESQGLELGNAQIYCNLIEGYIGLGKLRNAVAVYDQMSRQRFVPTPSCFHVFIDFLVRKKETQLAYSVCLDMVERAVNLSCESKNCADSVIRLLCESLKMHEVRNLLKKVINLQGWKPCNLVLNDIVRGYCEKKDFEDLISLYKEFGLEPDTVSGNWIMHALCKSFGLREGDRFRLNLEHQGFVSDEITFGILIGWNCQEGNLKMAFFYLSEILARGLKPDLFSYNALICGVFKQGIWEHAFDILNEMVDKRTFPDLCTFRILLAGFCKARQFDLVRTVILEMSKLNLVQLSPLDDPLCKAFAILGFDPLAVRLKRDCGAGLSRTEFYDNIGNGLYLDTDLDAFDRRINQILEESTIPDFNSLVSTESGHGNLKTGLRLVDEMHSRGQCVSSSALSALVKGLCLSQSAVREINQLLDKMHIFLDKLDGETLNSLAQFYCKKGLSRKGMKVVMEAMSDRFLMVENETCTALVTSLCKKGDLRGLLISWDLARKNKWIPSSKDVKPVLRCLCCNNLLYQAIELLERMLTANPFSQVYNVFLEELCSSGFTTVGNLLAEELLLRGCFLDRVAHNHLIRGFCLENKHSEAVRLFGSVHMGSTVLDPDVLVLLIRSLCMAERFKEVIALRDTLATTNSSLSPTVQSALAEGYFRAGRAREGISLVWNLLSEGICPGTKTNDTMVQAICKSNSICKVEELLAFMIKRNICISVSSFRNIVRLLCMVGRLAHAMNLKQFVLGQRNSDAIIVYNILIFYIFSSGRSSVVNKVLDEMLQENLLPDEFMYNLLVSGFARCKDTPSSLHHLQSMISNDLRPRNRSVRIIISCLLNDAEFGLVTELYQEMESRGWISNSTIQNTIAHGLVSHGKVHEAESFVDRFVSSPSIPNGVIYDSLIKWLCKQGRMGKAASLLNIMLKSRSVPDPSCYNSLVHGFCTSDELDQAMDFYVEMSLRDFRPSIETMETLVQKCCEKGRTMEAEGLLVSMAKIGVSPTREMYCNIINRYRFESNPKKASELIQAMQKSGYDPDFETHWSLISTLNKPKDEEENSNNRGFLSGLLSRSGFSWRRNDTKK